MLGMVSYNHILSLLRWLRLMLYHLIVMGLTFACQLFTVCCS